MSPSSSVYSFLFFVTITAANTVPPGALLHLKEAIIDGSSASKLSSQSHVIEKLFNFLIIFCFKMWECNIRLQRDLGNPQPLYLRSDNGQFLFPQTSAGVIELNNNETVDIFCPSGFRGRLETQKNKTISAQCVSGSRFRVGDQQFAFNEFACRQMPQHRQRRTNQTCTNGQIVEIGFQTEKTWLKLITVCHNTTIASTRWVHYYQNPANQGFQRGFPRIGFIQGDLYNGLNVNNLYTRFVQRQTISKILGSEQLGADLVQQNGDLFLSRGHLAARSDYIFGTHQQASFYFSNAAPQWQTFNGGNWAVLEAHLKRYVDRQNINIEIYTGTYGVVTYRDVQGVPREIYLASNETERRIPVPKVYYKVAIDYSRLAGVAFIGVNNPYATMEDILSDYTYCENVMDKINYIPWNSTNTLPGYLYACSVNEFAKFIGELPELPKIDKLLV